MKDNEVSVRIGEAAALKDSYSRHDRAWGDFKYVYPVISRRSGGLSVGINLNLDRACNFNCVYCQVARGETARPVAVDLGDMQIELESIIELLRTGELWRDASLAGVPEAQRRFDNIAFSGDGEPTLCRWFEQAVAIVVATKMRRGLDAVKLVLITNGSRLRDTAVELAMRLMDHHQGEVWVKLDAGDEASFQSINRARFTFDAILENLRHAGRSRDLVIQTMLLRRAGETQPMGDFDAYLERLAALQSAGCRIGRVQLYTIARVPSEPGVAALSDDAMDAFLSRLQARLPALPAAAFYGV